MEWIHICTAQQSDQDTCSCIFKNNHNIWQQKWTHNSRFYCHLFYTASQKNVPSLTGYRVNKHPPIFIIFGMSSADVQKFGCTSQLSQLHRFYLLYNALNWNDRNRQPNTGLTVAVSCKQSSQMEMNTWRFGGGNNGNSSTH